MVHEGEEIIISKAGKPCAKLVPCTTDRKRHPDLAQGRVTDAFFKPLPEEELDGWEKGVTAENNTVLLAFQKKF